MHGQKKKQQLNERTTPLVPKKQCGWLYSFAITYKHSNCSVNLQGNHGMAFGRVVKTNKSFYFLRLYIWLIRSGNSKTRVGRNAAACGSWWIICGDFGKFEWTAVESFFLFFFVGKQVPVQFYPKQFQNMYTLNYHQPRRKVPLTPTSRYHIFFCKIL